MAMPLWTMNLAAERGDHDAIRSRSAIRTGRVRRDARAAPINGEERSMDGLGVEPVANHESAEGRSRVISASIQPCPEACSITRKASAALARRAMLASSPCRHLIT